ncbi:hypothetical protein F3K02_08895 [Hydrogenophaga sp. D2P1]|uniref:Uncharacterized protein n=1 Tax=Hydrogenophaga aromaticivorans TaxID=2610898 RepID=A0A7Y8GWN0_9BURK|nr:hypothetical protein [Hydrogenophaga aromaticivorans]NWF45363.1 hypothetical protein [Hydrogenophaga aromaticivorans]
MGAALLSGLANMGTTGLKAYNDEVDKKRRQEKEDADIAWQNEQRDAIRAERAQKQQLKTSLAAAARPAQVDAGYQVTDAAGSNAFTKDADAAAVMGDMVADQRPSLASATRVQDTAYRDPKQAQAAEQQYNSTPATLGRMSTAAMPIDAERGLKLADSASTAAKTQKALKDEEIAQVNELFNRQILTIASSGPDWSARAAEALTKSNAPGLQGMQVDPALSQDGKTVSFKVVLPSGETKIVGSYENTERGAEQWVRDSSRVDFKTKIGWLNENMKHERELEKIAARNKGDKAPSGWQWNADRTAQTFIPGGPADPANRKNGDNTMLRVTVSGQRDSAAAAVRDQRKVIADLESKIAEDRDLRFAVRDGAKSEHYGRLQEIQRQIKEAQQELQTSSARVKEFDAALDEMSRDAIGNRGGKPSLSTASSGQSPSARPSGRMSLASTSAESDRAAILNAELKKARDAYARNPSDSRAANDIKALESEIIRLPKSSAAVGLSSAQQPARQAAPVKVTTKAERDALPAGTQYIDPNGQIFMKK